MTRALLISPLLVFLLIVWVLDFNLGVSLSFLIPILAMMLVMIAWGSLRMTVQIDVSGVTVRCPWPWGVRFIPMPQIRSWEVRRAPWGRIVLNNYGLLSRTYAYLLSTSHAVDVALDDGRRVRISTGQPEQFVLALAACRDLSAGPAGEQ